MGCGCNKARSTTTDYAKVKWMVNGTEYATLAAARTAAQQQGAPVQRLLG